MLNLQQSLILLNLWISPDIKELLTTNKKSFLKGFFLAFSFFFCEGAHPQMAWPLLLSLALRSFDCTPAPGRRRSDGGGEIKEKEKKRRERKPLPPSLEAGQKDYAGVKVLSAEICVCCWRGYSFLCEAGPPLPGNVCADGSRCVVRLLVTVQGGQLHSRSLVAVLDAKLIDQTERFIASCRKKRVGLAPLSPALQGHASAVGSGSFPNSPCRFLKGMEKPWHSRWQAHTFRSMWA